MRCLENGMEAAPADAPNQRVPGRLGNPPWGYYGPCARSSLTTQSGNAVRTQARTRVAEKCRGGAPGGARP